MVVPFALSVHTFINHVGAYVGFASIVGLALLVLLHFAQARETSTLRKHLEESNDRIVSLESRLSQVVRQGQPAVRAVPASPGPPTVTPAPIGAKCAAVRRVPAPAMLVRSIPGAPAGLAAPALASATRLITTAPPGPVPAAVPAVAPAPAVVGGLAAVAAAPTGAQERGAGLSAPDDTLLVAPATAAARGNGHDQTAVVPAVAASQAPAGPPPPTPPPPRAQIRQEPARPPRRTVVLPPKRRSFARRMLPAVLGAVIIAVIVVAVLVVMGNGGNSKTASSGTRSVSHFHPSRVTVAVLNGTSVTHLAKRVATMLHASGYQKGTVANATVQTHGHTIVGYVPHHREAAVHVARALNVSSGSISVADQAATSACASGATSSGGTSCSADVIVTVGSNLAHLGKAAGAG
jgi:LytR cell envelope-related transcriptional attenuator